MSSAQELRSALDSISADIDFSGVVHVSLRGTVIYGSAHGWADRAHEVPNTLDTQFALASGAKGFTAVGVMALVADGSLKLTDTVREILGDALDQVDPTVTVEHLLSHTSGIGDYLDEEELSDIHDYILSVPVHELATARDYLAVLRGHPTKFPPGDRFAYCNSGYVVLALIIEAVSGLMYHDVLDARVFGPAGMASTAFFRSDELPGRAAIGYIPHGDGWRTNQLHLPVRGVGDGGAYSTPGDLIRFWNALFEGRIVPSSVLEEMVRPRNNVPSEGLRYGMGFWLRSDRDTVMLEGYDPGISFRSAFDPSSKLIYTVMSNTSAGAWPVVKALDELLPQLAVDVLLY